jgi:predicted glutamine amidotransferase
MCAMIISMSNDPERLPCWLTLLDTELHIPVPPEDLDGWGVGYYVGDNGLSIKRPHSPRPWKFHDELDTIRTKTVLWRVTHRTAGVPAALVSEPLHYDRWLFVHEGDLELRPDAYDDLRATLADHFVRRMHGDDRGEALFFTMLHALHKAGWLDTLPQQLPPVVEALQGALASFTEQWCLPGKPLRLAAMLTNGRVTFIFSREAQLHLAFKEGLTPCQHCGKALADDFTLRESHTRARAVVVTHGLSVRTPSSTWQPVDSESIVAIDRDLTIHHFHWPIAPPG